MNLKINEMKRYLKNRVKITKSLVIKFLMTGMIVSSTVSFAAIKDTSNGNKISISSPSGSTVNGSKNGIAIGNGAYIEDMGNSEEGIAIGTGAKALDGTARRSITGGVSGIAIGKKTYASESTVDIGAKSKGSEAEGANRRGVVSIGADSYAAAHFSTITGSYSKIKTNPNENFKSEFLGVEYNTGVSSQGFASTISGTANEIIADKAGATYDGMANAITGTGNIIEHSNGALIMGAGNKISNSLIDTLKITGITSFNAITDPKTLNDLLNKETYGKKPELASVGVFGGANEVDNANFVNVSGVNNKLKGGAEASKYVSIDGYMNKATNVEHLLVQGSHNEVTNGKENIVLGNYNKLTGDDRTKLTKNIIMGFQDKGSNKIGKNISKNQAIGSNIEIADNVEGSTLMGDTAKIYSNRSIAIGYDAAAGRDPKTNGKSLKTTDAEIAIGHQSVAEGYATVALGNNAKGRGSRNIAIGDLATVGNKITDVNDSLAIGSNRTTALSDKSVSLGYAAKIYANSKESVSLGSEAKVSSSERATAIGAKSQVKAAKAVALGAESVADRVALTGVTTSSTDVKSSENKVYSLEVANEEDKQAIIDTVKGDLGAVSVGSKGATRQIINVAAGSEDTDAVNVAQLKAIGNKIDQLGEGINLDLDKVKDKADMAVGGVANAIAMASLTQVSYRGLYKNQISGGYGYFGGEHAIAAGISGISKNGKAIYKVIGSINTKGDLGVGAAVGYQFNKDKSQDKDERLEREIKRNADLENEVDALKNELKALNDKMNNFMQNINNSGSKYSQKLYTLNGYRIDIYGLTSSQINELREIVKDLNENYKGRTIDITGFTDTLANEKYNLELGLNRARQVLSKLKELGLSEEVKIGKVSSFGQNNVLDTNKTSNGKYSNRRVEILVK